MDYHKINLKGISKHNMAKKEKKGPGLWAEFKEFINRGNAFMLAVGVVIGGAFGAIVNAFVNMLMSLATWPVPGGLAGLVTVLPALTEGQKGIAGVGQSFAAADYNTVAKSIGDAAGATDPLVYGATVLNGNYTKYGIHFPCFIGTTSHVFLSAKFCKIFIVVRCLTTEETASTI